MARRPRRRRARLLGAARVTHAAQEYDIRRGRRATPAAPASLRGRSAEGTPPSRSREGARLIVTAAERVCSPPTWAGSP
jgi:hypothetical protein